MHLQFEHYITNAFVRAGGDSALAPELSKSLQSWILMPRVSSKCMSIFTALPLLLIIKVLQILHRAPADIKTAPTRSFSPSLLWLESRDEKRIQRREEGRGGRPVRGWSASGGGGLWGKLVGSGCQLIQLQTLSLSASSGFMDTAEGSDILYHSALCFNSVCTHTSCHQWILKPPSSSGSRKRKKENQILLVCPCKAFLVPFVSTRAAR